MMQMMRSLPKRKQRMQHTPSNSKECAVSVESMDTWPRIVEIIEVEEDTLVEAVAEAMVDDLEEDPEEVVTGTITTRESRASASIVALLDTVKRTAERKQPRLTIGTLPERWSHVWNVKRVTSNRRECRNTLIQRVPSLVRGSLSTQRLSSMKHSEDRST